MATPNIAGKVVIITGASSGIGESTARLLAGEGAKVVLAARRKDRLDSLVEDIRAAGGSAIGFKTDVTERDQVEKLVQDALNEHDRIDVMVNNSGIMQIAPMAALKVEEWDRMIDVNIKGLLYDNAAAAKRTHHQHRVCRGIQGTRARRHRLQRHQVRGARDHRGSAHRGETEQHTYDHHLPWGGGDGAPRNQL